MRGLFNDKLTGRVTDDDDYDDGDDDIVGIDDVDNDDHNGGVDGDDHGVDDGGENCDTGCQNSGRSKSKRGSDDTALTNSTVQVTKAVIDSVCFHTRVVFMLTKANRENEPVSVLLSFRDFSMTTVC